MNTNQKRFYIDKATGTFADELVAGGFVRLLGEVGAQVMGRKLDVVQHDRGAYYEVECAPGVDLAAVAAFEGFMPLAPLIQTPKNKKKLPSDLPIGQAFMVDYEAERDQRGVYLRAWKELPKTAKRADIVGERDPELERLPPAPHPDWHLFRAINPASLIGYNSLLLQWYASPLVAGQALPLLFEMFGQPGNEGEAARKAWRKVAKAHKWKLVDASASQLFNPSQGKGINKAKSNSASLGNLKNFWLLELLKVVGLYEVGFTRTLQGSGDRKTYVLAPGRLAYQTHNAVMKHFRGTMRFDETAIRSDILVVIRYVRAFIGYVEEAQAGKKSNAPSWFLTQVVRPATIVHGFHVAYYKDMGNAVVTMNLAFLNLPGWITIRNAQDARVFQDVLSEHERIVKQFKENRGEEVNLLTFYRDFIVADHLDPFFRFTTAYSSYIISQQEKGHYVHLFKTEHLRILIMSSASDQQKKSNYKAILENSGFRNVANAIRHSTIVPQWEKAKKNRGKKADMRYDIRYGLGQELVRRSQYAGEFLATLGEFLQKYSAESAQVKEKPNSAYPYYRPDIYESDLEEIMELVDLYGSDIICKLLIAFGYARSSKVNKENGGNE
ncbi:MAG: hypothetical protein ACPGWR_14825 [Ardenticatenaceae bacterium]